MENVFSVCLAQSYPYQKESIPVPQRVKDLLSRMTLEEKIAELNLIPYYTKDDSICRSLIRAGKVGAFLKANGAELGISKPFQMFWATGALSSFLDNTPTYLVFLTTAGALGFKGGVATTLGAVPVKMLEAISCGAVFMGANTYIGNAPNFMVKSMSDENGVRMPSFFGYMAWSLTFLIPVFIIDMLIFFL